jgi:biopolymer transport protein ExbD
MLDIVFIMLIFFIVTTSFVKEKGLTVSRPDDNQNKTQTKSKNLSVRIDEHGYIYMGNRQVDIERVTANAQTFLAENNTESAVIQAHAKTKHGIVVRVYDQVKEAGIKNLSVLKAGS